MADYIKRNLVPLIRQNPIIKENYEYFKRIISQHLNSKDVWYQDGMLYFRQDGKPYRAFGKNPKKEAEYLIRDIEPSRDHLVIVFGIANIELLHTLLYKTSANSKIAVIEPNLDIFAYCIKNYNLHEYISSEKFGFLIGEKHMLDREINLYFTGSWLNLLHNMLVISLPNYYLYKEFSAGLVKKVREGIFSKLMTLGNSLEDMLDGLRNHYLNIDSCILAGDGKEIEGKYKGVPAIIVAAGPSLDKNIDDLKAAQGKALIIACDASYQICLEHGIIPDAIASIERGIETYQAFFEGRTFDKNLVLLAPSLLWPNIHEEFPGKQFLVVKNYLGLEGWWQSIFPNEIFLNTGHSCATLAFSFVKWAGCENVIYAGLDLAYTDEKKHSDRIHSDSFQSKNELSEEEKEKKELWTEDIHGGQVRTSMVFNLFRHYLEDATMMEGTIIDATEGGALIHGTKLMTLKEAIALYCNNPVDRKLYDLIINPVVTDQNKIEKYNEILDKISHMIEKLLEIQKLAVEHYKVLEKYKGTDFNTLSYEELVAIVIEMQKGNEVLNYLNKDAEEAYSFYQQILRQTVIYVKKIGNEITGKTVKRNWELQVNLMYLIDITSVSAGKEMDKMRSYVLKKKEDLQEVMESAK